MRTPKFLLLVALGLGCSVSCAGNLDTSRPAPPKSTLGDDIYSVVCDRLGASVFAEDLSGASFHAMCHIDADGHYTSDVDTSKLPPVSGAAAITRRLAIAKMRALARRRPQLIQALNATFDDGTMPIPFDSGKTIRVHEALTKFLQAMVPLYDHNPIDPKSEPLMASMTRAAGRLFAGLGGPAKGDPFTDFVDAQTSLAGRQALASISGRQGYRPLSVILGAIRPALAYPGLREMAQVVAPKLGPGGSMHDDFQDVLGMTEDQLATSTPAQTLTPYVLLDANKLQPNRPRTKVEIASALLLSENPAFAALGAEPRYLVERDVRGVAVPAGNAPGTPGTVAAPFVDANGDGLVDVDGFGRLITTSGVQVDTPFSAPGITDTLARDTYGRALDASGQPLYQYIDTSNTFAASLLRDLLPLVDPNPVDNHETIANLLLGAYRLYGDPVQKPASWAVGGKYSSFDASDSPLVDLIYATGQIFANKDSDVMLKLLEKLLVEDPNLVARLIGDALQIRAVSNQHPEAKLAPTDTFWDELSEDIVKLTDDPALFDDVLRALENPDVQSYLGDSFGNYATYKDLIDYEPSDLNGPAIDTSAGGQPIDPQVPVDRSAPDSGDNRSEFYRILQLIHDVDGVTTCNKGGAKVQIVVSTPLGQFTTSWPLTGSYKECELFVFQNLGVVYLQSILGEAKMNIRQSALNDILSFLNTVGINVDQLLEQASGITGMTQTPTPQAFNRLVFFGATGSKYDPMPDADPFVGSTNKTTNGFISTLMDPVSTSVCPVRTIQDPDGQLGALNLADCSNDKQDLARIRDTGTIFAWERYNFYKGIAPVLKAFDNHGDDQLFLDFMETLYRHWPSPQHGPSECSKTGTWIPGQPGYNPKYCAESGLERYEPILSAAFKSDLIPALGQLVQVLDDQSFVVTDARNGTTRTGLDLLHEMTQVFFDPKYAASVGMVDRQGNASTTWADGKTPKAQLTPFDLFAEAMRGIDERLANDPRLAGWHQARSELVDAFLTIDGSGATSTFHDQAVPKALPTLIDILREQINANCPDRETSSVPCQWATTDLAQHAADTIGEPTFSATMNLVDEILSDPASRSELEKFFTYLLTGASDNDALNSTLTSMSDVMQVIDDDKNMPAIYNAISLAASPDQTESGSTPAPGAADRMLELLQAVTAEPVVGGQPTPNPYDRYHVLDRILKNLVTPMDPNDPQSQTPLEVFIDTIAQVNRIDASAASDAPLGADDYQAVFATLRDFMTSKRRGLEQFYEIVHHRNGN
jgi:hypothetical protein